MYEQSLSLSLKRSFIIIFSLISLLGYGYFAFAVIPPNTTLDPVTTNPTECSGPTPWNDPDCVIQLTSGTNGLSMYQNDIGLGGTLDQDTIIDTNGNNFSVISTGTSASLKNSLFVSTSGIEMNVDFGSTNGGDFYKNKFSLNDSGFFARSDFNQISGGASDAFAEINTGSLLQGHVGYGTGMFLYEGLDVPASATMSGMYANVGNDGNPEGTTAISVKNEGQEQSMMYTGLDYSDFSNTSIGGAYAAIHVNGIDDNSHNFFHYLEMSKRGFIIYPQSYLQVEGNLQVSGLSSGSGCSLSADTVGNIICSPSDQKLKQNIENISYGLDTITALRPVSYNFKDTNRFGANTKIGFLAQDLQKVVPEVVSDSGEYLSVDYSALTPVIVKAIQELNLKVDMLELSSGNTSNSVFVTLKNWFSDTANGIGDFIARRIIAREELCIDDICVTKDQLKKIIDTQVLDTDDQTDIILENNEIVPEQITPSEEILTEVVSIEEIPVEVTPTEEVPLEKTIDIVTNPDLEHINVENNVVTPTQDVQEGI